MDTRSEIREFLTSRRARITPDGVGLPVYGDNRRVPGLRREEVALLAGVSVDYYTKLERGHLSGASDDVLDALARALRLDEAERAHLFDLARASQPATATPAAGRYPRERGPPAPGGEPTTHSDTSRTKAPAPTVRSPDTGAKRLHPPVVGPSSCPPNRRRQPRTAGWRCSPTPPNPARS